MRILANLNVVGTLDLDSVANAGVDTDRFLVQDANGVVRYRTGAEVASDIGSANLAASVLKHQVKLGEAIAKGQAVYVSSSDGTNMIVSKASNASESTSSKTLGLLETGGALNAQVNVITEGLLAGLDTSTANAGDPVWLGTNGNLIFGLPNKPYAPAHLVFIGIVTRVQQINGEIFIKPQNGFELQELHNVQITTTPADNTVLSYENSSSLYKMKSIATLLGYTPANAARNITINGTTYDLTADRTWNVGTVTSIGVSVPTGLAVSNTPITGAGTIAISLAAGYSIPTTASQSNWDTAYGWGNHASAGYQVTSQKGQPNGYASLDGGGKVPSTQLPSYVDDVLEYANLAGFPGTGETGKIYVALDNNKIYRWSGTAYIEISPTVGTVWGTITGTLSNQTDLQSALDAKVPTSRTITINGTSFDLSANRSWTVGDVRTDGSYANPAWITSLAWSKITGAPAFLTAEADTLATVTGRGNTTSTYISVDYVIATNNGNGTNYRVGDDAWFGDVNLANTVRLMGIQNNANGYIIFGNGDNTALGRAGTGALTYGGNTVYHSGNLTNLNQLTNGPGYITGNQTITLSGDATGSGTTSIGVTLANSGVVAGTYTKVTVDAKGRVTSGTTLSAGDIPTLNYVAKSGDSMTGNLSFGSSGAGITWAANTDGASITFESTGDGASSGRALSNLLIALSDNGDEGLKVTSASAELLYVNTNQFQYKGNTIWHAGNDGSGSGLDADLLDGVSSASFLRSDVVDANLTGTILSTNNANVDGANFEVDTTNKTVNEYAYKVSRSGSAVGGILIDGRGAFASGTTVNGSTVWHQGNLTNLNQLTNGPGYITGYTETDTLASVTGRGNTTSVGATFGTAANALYTGPGGFLRLNTNTNNPADGRNAQSTVLLLTNYGGDIGTDGTVDIDFVTVDGNSVVGAYPHVRIGYTGAYNDGINSSPEYEARGYFRIATRGEGSGGVLADRLLIDHNGTLRLLNYTTNGFLKFSSSNGTVVVDTNTYLTSYTETDTLASVTGRGASTSTFISINNASQISNNTSVDPANYANKVVVGAVGDSGWRVSTGIGGNAGANHNWTFGHNGSNLYFGISNGSSASLSTWMQVTPGRTIIIPAYTSNGFLKTINSDGTLSVDTNTYATSTGGNASGTWGINITGNAATVTNGVYTNANNSLTGGNRIVIQASQDGGNSRGIFMWNGGDSNWGIYMAQAGAGKALSDGTAPAGIDGRTEHAIRFRVASSTTQIGFLWENSDNNSLMQLQPNTGNLYTRGQIYAGNSTSNLVWHSGNLTNLNQLSNGPGYITSSSLSAYLPLAGGTMTGDLRFNQGSGYGRIAFSDNYHGMILRGIPSDAAGNVTVGDYTSLIQHSGDFRFYRTNGSINELYFQVNATAAYWRGNTIIHSGTIGSQSVAFATNADTVDGYHMNQNVLTTSSPTFQNVTADGSVAAYGLRFRNGTAITYCGFGGGELNNIFHTESAWGNLRHNDISNYEVSADGSSWSAGTLDANIYNLFLGERDKGGSLTIAASGLGRYQRFTFAIGYKNFDMLHITGSTNGEQIYIKLETSTDGGSTYTENFTSIWSSWPGNHSKVWSIFNSAITRIRLTIYKPGNNYGNSASINSINYYGGYSGYGERYHMQVYSYDYQSASINRNTFIGGSLTVYSNQTIAGSGYGLYFSGGNNRIYFGGNRAIEGNGTNLQIGEGHSQTQIQSATTQVDGNIVMAKGSDPRIYSNTNVGLNIDGQALYLNRYVGSDISMVFGGGNVMIGPYSGPSFALHVKKNQNQVAGFESPNANTWIDLISTAGTWSMGATSSNTWAIYQRGVANATRFEVGPSSASLYGNTVWHAGNLTNLNQLSNGPGYVTSANWSILGTGVSYNTDRTTKVSNGLAIYGAYSGGANSPTTYDIAAQFVLNSRAMEFSASWHAPSATLYFRTLRDCCDNWSSWVTMLSSANYSSYALALSGGTMSGNLYIQSGANPTQFNLRGTNPELYVDATYGGGTARLFINRQSNANQATLLFTTGATVTNGTAWNFTGTPIWSMGMTNSSQVNDFKLAYGDIYDTNSVALRIDTNKVVYFSTTPYVGGNAIWHAGNLTNLNQLSNGPGYITSSALSSYIPYGNWSQSTGMNDNKLYLRTNGDNNHFLWNADDDWEELRFYTGTGFRLTGSDGTGYYTFSTSNATFQRPLKVYAQDNNPISFTNVDAGSSLYTDRGGRLLTSNGTGWLADGRDPILVIGGSYSGTERGRAIGLALHNETNTNNTYSPLIAFSTRSNSGSYNTTYAAIMGKHTGVASGLDTNWAAGELHFYVNGPGYMGDTPTVSMTASNILAYGNIMLHAGNYNSYSPTLTGGNASGTWGINITGSAGSVSWGNVSSKPASWLNTTNLIDDYAPQGTAVPSGFYQNYAGSGNPTGTWFNYINVRHSNPANGHGFQIGMSYYDTNLWFRSYQGGTSPTFSSWATALSTLNYSSYVIPIGGSWYGSGLPGSRWYGYSVNGGEFVLGNGLPNAGQVGVLVDGCYVAGENNGFWSLASDNTWGSRRGMYWDGSYLNFTTNTPTARFQAVYADGDITAFSDARVKENIRSIDNALQKVLASKGVMYDRIDTGEKDNIGFIAQELEEQIPNLVKTDTEGFKSVKYQNMVAILTEAIKEQQKQIEELKEQLKNK